MQCRPRRPADFFPSKSELVLNFTLTSLRPKESLSSAARAGIVGIRTTEQVQLWVSHSEAFSMG